MKNKIIYILDQLEVKMGDDVNVNGFNVTITQELIDKNPDFFKVEEVIPDFVEAKKTVDRGGETLKGRIYRTKSTPESPYCWFDETSEDGCTNSEDFWSLFNPSTSEKFEVQEIMDKAKVDYPIGIKFIDAHVNPEKGVFTVSKYEYHFDENYPQYEGIIGGKNDNGNNVFIWTKSMGWADKVMPLFKTEDGVEVFKGEKTFVIKKDTYVFPTQEPDRYVGDEPDFLYFSTKAAALEYVDKHKTKTLYDYERELFRSSSLYSILKTKEPKLFNTKILQLIADDLNEGDKFVWGDDGNDFAYIIAKVYCDGVGEIAVHAFNWTNYGGVCFKSEALASKAVTIMGDKLNLIF